jgi:hypothetical protein
MQLLAEVVARSALQAVKPAVALIQEIVMNVQMAMRGKITIITVCLKMKLTLSGEAHKENIGAI